MRIWKILEMNSEIQEYQHNWKTRVLSMPEVRFPRKLLLYSINHRNIGTYEDHIADWLEYGGVPYSTKWKKKKRKKRMMKKKESIFDHSVYMICPVLFIPRCNSLQAPPESWCLRFFLLWSNLLGPAVLLVNLISNAIILLRKRNNTIIAEI